MTGSVEEAGTDGRGRGADVDENREAAREELVERFASHLVDAGMPRMSARVFVCLLCEDSGVLTAAELAERLRVSPAAVSGAVRYLSQVYLVSRERQPGSRRERYRVQDDQWFVAMVNRSARLSNWEETVRQGAEAVGPDTPAGRRLAETGNFLEYFRDSVTEAVVRWRESRDEK